MVNGFQKRDIALAAIVVSLAVLAMSAACHFPPRNDSLKGTIHEIARADGWPNAMENRTWGGQYQDIAYDIAIAADGIYMTGGTSSFGTGFHKDAFLAKFNFAGDPLWNLTWGGVESDSATSVAIAIDGIYIAGITESFAAGYSDAFLVKYSTTGVQLWNRTWGGDATDAGYGVAVGSDGVYLVGYTGSYGAGAWDAFLVKYSSSGAQLWNQTWGGSDSDAGASVAIASDGIYVTGSTESFGEGDEDIFLVKYDSSGTQFWNHTWGGALSDTGNDVAVATDGIYVSGSAGGALLIKWDSDGYQIWNKTWSGASSKWGECVAIATDGVYQGGDTWGYGAGYIDVFLVKYAANGTRLWNRTWGGESLDQGHSVAATADGVYLAGYTESFGAGIGDAFLDKYDPSGNQPPSITRPVDVSYSAGQTGIIMAWTITDTSTSTTNYTIYRNGTSVASGSWASGSPVTRSVSGLSIGDYNYTIVATDGYGGTVSDMVLVHVVPNVSPTITRPTDITFNGGSTGNSISWTITDAGTETRSYEVYRNGTSVASGTWISGTPVVRNVDGLNGGVYNYTIVATDGLGGSVTDMVLVTVSNLAPTITQPADITYTAGQTGNSIWWTVTDATTGTRSYTIYRNGTSVASSSWISGTPVFRYVDGLNGGVYNYTIVASDGLGGSVTDMVLVTVSNPAPTITQPADITYTAGQTGNSIWWTVTDATTSTRSYTIYRNGTSVASSSWASGSPVTRNVDGLSIGDYNYTIVATDGYGGTVSDMVLVHVVPNVSPTITQPSDVTYTAGQTGNTISWTATDATTGTRSYTIFRNGTSVASGMWTSGSAVPYKVDGLTAGVYNFTIVFYDGLGGSVQDIVLVNVGMAAQPWIETQAGMITLTAILISVGAGAVIGIVGAKKKKITSASPGKIPKWKKSAGTTDGTR
jgi:hypothetical protein